MQELTPCNCFKMLCINLCKKLIASHTSTEICNHWKNQHNQMKMLNTSDHKWSVFVYSLVNYYTFFQADVQSELVEIQPQFKTRLLDAVEVFREDLVDFEQDYETVSVVPH